MLVGAAYGLAFMRHMVEQSSLGLFVHWIFVLFSPLAFIVTMLSNPGIYDPDENYEPKRT